MLTLSCLLVLSISLCLSGSGETASAGSPNILSGGDVLGDQPNADVTDSDVQCSLRSIADRFNCHPEHNATEKACHARGCCWRSGAVEGSDVPLCFFPKDYLGYRVVGIASHDEGVRIKLSRQTPSGIDDDVQTVDVGVVYYDRDTVRITIVDTTRERFVPPLPEIPTRTFKGRRDYIVNASDCGVLSVHRLDEHNTTLFSANLSRLVFTDYFLQLSTLMPTDLVYGLGEQWTSLRRSVDWRRYYLFTRDGWPRPNINLYGAHPFYVALERGGSSHGIYLHNSNFIEVLLQPTSAATFRTLGGMLDFFVFAGPSPGHVVQQYQRVVGFPTMPPYWALGFHLCRYGYGTLNRTREIMEKNIQAGIPLDIQWNDIDYMDSLNDFTYDKDNYADLPDFVAKVHEGGRHYVMIFDPGVSGSEMPGTYPPLDEGLQMGVFVKNVTGGIVYAKVWNKVSTVFPDFTHPNSTRYWTRQFRRFHDTVPFDGAWIDMNEPSNRYDGHKDGCPRDQRVERPPYVPGHDPLSIHTLCMSDQHYLSSHYNVHSVYSQLEARATHRALVETRQKRPFIISRSTSPGQGAWSGHWSGDIQSSWEDLRLSIPNVLSFGMYGIPLSGADICGFQGNTTVELCARWQVVGAFYPFARNHNSLSSKDQDPYSMGPEVVRATRIALTVRYAMLPYLYTLFYRSHVYGETVARALFFEFPEDPRTYDIEEQFMWGSALLISPALHKAQTEVEAYVPRGTWYDLNDGRRFEQPSGGFHYFSAPMDKVNILVRGGHLVPMQEPSVTTTMSRKNPIWLFVAPDDQKKAQGAMYWDDGESLDAVQKQAYSMYNFTLAKNLLTVNHVNRGSNDTLTFGGAIVTGVDEQPRSVRIVGGRPLKFYYSHVDQMLRIFDIAQPMDEDFSITWAKTS
ncbi:lysosomal alpha-glucosidase-like isoform X1 [Dermacentor albipictus]|uniref:lysosomal alpha-glucosidase-like isoform X1 n=1 Tax=Dermacentor albipictus TaxID=60249 RepID=UPI0038FBE748